MDSDLVKVPKDLESLIPKFLENRRKDLGEIKSAIKNNGFNKLKEIGHTLSGVGGGYGFYHITELGKKINKAAKEKNMAGLQSAADEFESHLNNLKVEYE